MKKSEIRQRLDKLRYLPPSPRGTLRLTKQLLRPEPNLDDIATHLARDPALAAGLLRGAALAGFSSSDLSAHAICGRLGLDTVRGIVAGSAATTAFSAVSDARAFDGAFWNHAQVCASVARLIAQKCGKAEPEWAYLAGLLHDIGKLALHAVAGEVPPGDVGVAHTQAGKWLATAWDLPTDIADTIWLHHLPEHVVGRMEQLSPLLDVVALANALVQTGHEKDPPEKETAGRLKRLGLSASIFDLARKHIETAEKASQTDKASGLVADALAKDVLALMDAQVTTASAGSAATHRVERFQALHRMLRAMDLSQTLPATVAAIAREIRKALGVKTGVCCATDSNRWFVYGQVWCDAEDTDRAFELNLTHKESEAVQDAAGDQSTEVMQALKELGLLNEGERRDGDRQEGGFIQSVVRHGGLVALPLRAQGRTWGQLLLDTATCDAELTGDYLQDLTAYAEACGDVIARQQAFERMVDRAEDLALASSDEEPASREHIRDRTEAALVTDLSADSAPSTVTMPRPDLKPTLINYFLHRVVVSMRERLLARGIRIEERYAEGLPRVKVDGHQMEEALSTIVAEAQNAMGLRGGVLIVETSCPDDRRAVHARVTATGSGAWPTASHGNQAGQSLALCRHIVESHNGMLDVQTDTPGHLVFTVTLPSVASAHATAPARAKQPQPQRHAPVTLVIDGDEGMREVLRSILESHGHRVLVSQPSVAALERVVAADVGLVILDIPATTAEGLRLLQAIHQRRPDLPVVAMPRAHGREDADVLRQRGASACLAKPFEMVDLLATLANVMGDAAPDDRQVRGESGLGAS